MTQTSKIYSELRNNKDARGYASISAKQVACLIRDRLKSNFPGIKFSVRSDYNSVRINWTDGPSYSAVNGMVQQYSFGGFDAMIDLAYSSDNWLLPDGSMQPASSRGTVGSMGTVDAYTTDCPEPGAILVHCGPRYVFASRDVSDALMIEMIQAAQKRYGFQFDPSRNIYDQQDEHGRYLCQLARRYEEDAA